MVVATAGATTTGVIDALRELGDVSDRVGLWFHIDAAWGGLVALVPEMRDCLDGMSAADSITFDPHKWMSVPMGAGLFLTRHPHVLTNTFSVDSSYIPKSDTCQYDPYSNSLQWSRRFIGLKVFLSLVVAGTGGYAEVIRRMVRLGTRLREELSAAGWVIRNRTPLPIVCFSNPVTNGEATSDADQIARAVVSRGNYWLSTVRLPCGETVLRACITNHRSNEGDVKALVEELEVARANAPG